MLLVSRCLVGEKCRYNGKGKPNRAVIEFLQTLQAGRDYVFICPEMSGKLPIPRLPGEIIGGNAAKVWAGAAKVQNPDGTDYTPGFIAGAETACQTAAKTMATAALLKEKSPSCGVHLVHNGHFDGTTVPGLGIAAYALARQGVRLFSEDDLDELKEYLRATEENYNE